MSGVLNSSTKRDVVRAARERIDKTGMITFPIEEVDGDVEIVIRSREKQSQSEKRNMVLHVSVIITNASGHTGNMLGYPHTLSQFPDEIACLPTELKDALDTAAGRNTGATFPYNHKEAEPPEAWYTTVLDVWLDDGEIDEVWVRARPRADD